MPLPLIWLWPIQNNITLLRLIFELLVRRDTLNYPSDD